MERQIQIGKYEYVYVYYPELCDLPDMYGNEQEAIKDLTISITKDCQEWDYTEYETEKCISHMIINISNSNLWNK